MVVTIRMVAEQAGVSAGTASRALRGHPQVSPECVERVRAAAQRLGYRPLRSHSGRGRPEPLVGKRIAIAMFGIDRTLASLPVVAEAIHGAEEALAEAGAHPILINVPHPAEPPASLRRVKFDGILAKAALQGNLIRAVLPRIVGTLRETPLVWLLGRPEGAPGDTVDPDDRRVGALAAEAILAQGHRRVAIVNPKPDHTLFAIRCQAVRRAIEQAGGTVAEFHPRGSRSVSFPLQPVMDVAQVLPLVDEATENLRRRPSRGSTESPSAIFCPADNIAALVFRALATRGIVAGRDMSVVSCQNERSLIAGLWPSLATIDVHPQRIGRMAVDLLSRRISGEFSGSEVQISVCPTFIPGGSLSRCRDSRRAAQQEPKRRP
jgi:DNA-binding LacI/PurR family transcriptional regulator